MCAIRWQPASTTGSLAIFWSKSFSAAFGPSRYERFPNACSRQPWSLHSASFVSSGLNVPASGCGLKALAAGGDVDGSPSRSEDERGAHDQHARAPVAKTISS